MFFELSFASRRANRYNRHKKIASYHNFRILRRMDMGHQELPLQGIVDLASAFYGSAVLFAAIENDVFTTIAKLGAGATAEGVAASSGASARGMRLLLDACVALDLLAKADDVYANTAAGARSLVAGSPADLSRTILYNRDVYPAWGRLSQLVKTGKPVEDPAIHLGADPARTRRFALSMRGRALAIGRSVVPMIDLAGCATLLDLAGGPGTYAELLARANPELRCTTVDLPAIAAVAAECIAEAGLADRVVCMAGDYHADTFAAESFDAATIFGALHQEEPAEILAILRRAHAALKPGGRLFVLDMMTDASHASPAFSALFAVNMALTTTNGWVFSDAELKALMAEAGFEPGETRPVPPPMPHWLVSAVKR